MSIRIQLALAATLAATTTLSTKVGALTLTTWNLQHMMSESTFDAWTAFCVKHSWDEEKVKAAGAVKPKKLTYCNAHNGLLYPTTIKESKPLQTRAAYSEKVAALVKRRSELNSDIFALQEVGDEAAVRLVFPATEWDVVATKAEIPQNIAFAVRKSSPIKIIKSQQVDALAQTDDTGHRVRPGLELTVEVGGTGGAAKRITILNVHLKASCRAQPISEPKRPGYADDRRWEEIIQGCKVMRKQVPELENWVEAQTRAGANYLIVGDWNRDLKRDLMLPARLTEGGNAKSPITADTKIGSLMKEISDDAPKGSYLTIAATTITLRKKTVRAPDAKSYDSTCHQGIDNFVLSDSMMKAFGLTKETLSAAGADYGAEAYGVEKAMPSDHCPVTLKLQ
jgi:hypothetical protein